MFIPIHVHSQSEMHMHVHCTCRVESGRDTEENKLWAKDLIGTWKGVHVHVYIHVTKTKEALKDDFIVGLESSLLCSCFTH